MDWVLGDLGIRGIFVSSSLTWFRQRSLMQNRLCGSLGPASYSSTGAYYQSSLSSMWGSAAYLLSSLFQWYEAVNKHENVNIANESEEVK